MPIPLLSPAPSSAIQALNVIPPLLLIHPLDSTVISDEPVNFALYIRRLRPDRPAAREPLDLLAELTQKEPTAVVPDFERFVDLVRLWDTVDGLLDVPEAVSSALVLTLLLFLRGMAGDVLLKRHIMPNPPEFTLQGNPLGIVGAGQRGPVRRSALRVGVVVVILQRSVSETSDPSPYL